MNQNWGLVLSGGGAKGAYQIGVWKAMKELHMEEWIGGISGSSIGTLNAALFACNNYENANEVWNQVNLLSVFDTEWALIDGKEGTFSREEMLTLFRTYVDIPKIIHSERPIYCSISRLMPDRSYQGEYARLDGRTQYIIEQLLMASSALPIIHEAVEYQDWFYRDGGLTDNVPIRPLYDHGFRKIIVIGLKEEMKRFEADFPDVEFLSVYPSHDLGDLIHGTLNFKPRFIEFCKKLGYKDGLRTFRAYQNGDMNTVKMQELAKLDFQELTVEMKQAELQSSVDEHMDTLKGIMGKYGID
ncbi:MAG: patatin-like phospholipase family protein [Lachnospiraceae bacterium]|nr:patatin-like phospholipase family protein [Lachnospiraceae bacterium]